MRGIIAAVAALLIFGLLAAVILSKEKKEKQLHQRLTEFSAVEKPEEKKQAQQKREKKQLSKQILQSVQKTARHVPQFRLVEWFDARMEMADWPFLGREYMVVLLVLGIFGAALFGFLTMDGVNAFIGFVAGIAGGLIFLDLAIQRRRKAFVNQLGDMLTMVANALRAGFSFMQAFELIAREMDAPVGREVEKVIREVNLGGTLDRALDHMNQRMKSPDFELVVTAVLIQRQVGGNLAEILDTIGYTIQERVRMRREVMALTSQGRMSGLVLTVLPFGLAFAIRAISPDYLTPLFTEPMGRMAVVGALVLIVIGYIVIQRIVDIKP